MVVARGGVGNDGRRSSKEVQQRWSWPNEAWATMVEAAAIRRIDGGGGGRNQTRQRWLRLKEV